MFMHGRQRVQAQTGCNLLIRRGIAVLSGEVRKKVDDFFLSPRDRHAQIVADKRRIATTIRNVFPTGPDCAPLPGQQKNRLAPRVWTKFSSTPISAGRSEPNN